MGDWEDVFGNAAWDDIENSGFFDDEFEKDEQFLEILNTDNKQHVLSHPKDSSLFSSITKRIYDQSYDYSDRRKFKRVYSKDQYFNTSLFFDTKNSKEVYIPLFNYFDRNVNWLKTNLLDTIKLTKANKFFGAYKNIFNENQMKDLFLNGNVQNLTIPINPRNSLIYNSDFNIHIIDEVLHTKRIRFLIGIESNNQVQYTTIPIEGALRVRGDNIFRTDSHGNSLSNEMPDSNERYKIVSF